MQEIGRVPRQSSEEPVQLLLECHARIRSFVGLALALGTSTVRDHAQIQDAARDVRRYFGAALPLHVADEEESLAPRLASLSPELSASLWRMRRDHAGHAPLLSELLARCDAIEREPAAHAREAAGIARLAHTLHDAFMEHLAEEERELFPWVLKLSRDEQRAIVAEMRARRRTST